MATSNGDVQVLTSYGNILMQQLADLYARDEYCDFTIKAQDSTFLVHKLVMCAVSDFFRGMLSSNMREVTDKTIVLDDITAFATKQLVEFVYSGKLNHVNLDTAEELIHAACFLQIHTAVDLCSQYLISQLRYDTVDVIWAVADKYSLKPVLDEVKKQALQNFSLFSKSLLNARPELVEECLQHDGVRVGRELSVFRLAERYLLKHFSDNLQNWSARLLRHIRFCLMTRDELDQIAASPVIECSTDTTELVSSAYQCLLDSRRVHPSVPTEQLRVRCTEQVLVLVNEGGVQSPMQISCFCPSSKHFFTLAKDTSVSHEFRVAAVGGYVYILRTLDLGGNTLMSSLRRFDPRHLTLQDMQLPQRIRLHASVAAVESDNLQECRLFYIGGETPTCTLLDSVEVYCPASNTWSESTPLPCALHSHSSCVDTHSRLWVSGGQTAVQGRPTTSVICWTPDTGWVQKQGLTHARRLHEMVCVAGKLLVAGGSGPDRKRLPLELYSPDTDQWTALRLDTLNGNSVGHFLSSPTSNTVYALGHQHYCASEDEIWQLDPSRDEGWSLLVRGPMRCLYPTVAGCICPVNTFDDNISLNRLRLDHEGSSMS